jgi:hypothetical protein
VPPAPDGALPTITLQPDRLWTLIEGYGSPDVFRAAAARVALLPTVPEAVAQRFAVVARLVALAYAEAAFLDVAFERALLTVELALRLRHDELGGPLRPRERTLARLAEWAVAEELVEDGHAAIDAARRLRNGAAHATNGPAPTVMALGSVEATARLLNDLYECPHLRRQRNVIRAVLAGAIGRAVGGGAVADLGAVGLSRLLVWSAAVLHVENRPGRVPTEVSEGTLAHVALWPLFDPSGAPQSFDMGRPVVLVARAWEERDGGLALDLYGALEGVGPRRVFVQRALDAADAARLHTWRTALGPSDSVAETLAAHTYGELRTALRANTTTHT